MAGDGSPLRTALAPTAAERDRTGCFPRDAFAEMGELGLMGLLVPPQLGGKSESIAMFVSARSTRVRPTSGDRSSVESWHRNTNLKAIKN
jgi:alkylation response protein AidB-like acyl-CoA dehydrogenase